MDLVAPRAGDHIVDGKSIDAAGRQNLDSLISVPDIGRDVGDAVIGACLLPGCHDAPDTKVDQLIERNEWIWHNIETPVKYGLPIATKLTELAAALHIDRS